MNIKRMRPPSSGTLYRPAILAFAALALSAANVFAAEAPQDEVVTLSPFEVTADDAVGYQATSTLAGTRIRTSLNDVASPISVFTGELMSISERATCRRRCSTR